VATSAFEIVAREDFSDVTAGTFAQLVEGAESCQVSIIHPGKPRDPNEPDLPELMRCAEVFQ
jgi:hypothetical protein